MRPRFVWKYRYARSMSDFWALRGNACRADGSLQRRCALHTAEPLIPDGEKRHALNPHLVVGVAQEFRYAVSVHVVPQGFLEGVTMKTGGLSEGRQHIRIADVFAALKERPHDRRIVGVAQAMILSELQAFEGEPGIWLRRNGGEPNLHAHSSRKRVYRLLPRRS